MEEKVKSALELQVSLYVELVEELRRETKPNVTMSSSGGDITDYWLLELDSILFYLDLTGKE